MNEKELNRIVWNNPEPTAQELIDEILIDESLREVEKVIIRNSYINRRTNKEGYVDLR